METNILNNIYHLYRSHIITLILFLILGCIAVLVAVGVMKFKLIQSKAGRLILLVVVIISLILLLFIQIYSIIPIYKDYKESSYVVLENVTLIIKTEASGVIDRTNTVIVDDGLGRKLELTMQSDLQLSAGCIYTGTVVYTVNSRYVVWYSFD